MDLEEDSTSESGSSQGLDDEMCDRMDDDFGRSPPVFYSPAVKTIQRIALYETKSRFYVVGSNNTQSRFRVLKIDRQDPRRLNISDDTTVYNSREIRELLTMIDVGNRSKVGQKMGSGLTRTVSAFGIAGQNIWFYSFPQSHFL